MLLNWPRPRISGCKSSPAGSSIFAPADAAARAGLDAHWRRLTGNHPAEPVEIEVKGRKVRVPCASMGVARFAFCDLCEQPLGALDYLHIAHAFHTVLIEGIPMLGPEKRNEARRFVTLIDTLYDNRVCLIASADGQPHELYPAGDGALMFERTASRLIEMRSEAYLSKQPSEGAAIKASGPDRGCLSGPRFGATNGAFKRIGSSE